MRLAVVLGLLTCLSAQAQIGSVWRGNIGGILGRSPAQVTDGDLDRFDQYLVGAGAYCSALTANDYAANRLMVRSMAAYVSTMNSYWRNSPRRARLGGLSSRISGFPCAWAGYRPAEVLDLLRRLAPGR